MDFLMDALYVVDDLAIRYRIMNQLKILSDNLQLFDSSEKNLFLGEQLFKLSSDLTAGTAGIILVLDRYKQLSEEGSLRPSYMFYLDEACNIFKKEQTDETLKAGI